MLVELSIHDFALIEKLELAFAPRLNVITGETGAGKSILLGALGALMGMRTASDVVRTGSDRAVIEGRFRLPDDHPATTIMHKAGGEADGGEVIARREIGADGRSRAWIGGASVPVRMMKTLGDRLVDFHGQHDHQLLLAANEHASVLDAFAGNKERVARVEATAVDLQDLRSQREELVARQEQIEAQREAIEFERADLDEIDPKQGEFESLDAERKLLENVEQLGGRLSGIIDLLSESEDSVVSRLGAGSRLLQEANEIDESLDDLAAEYEQMQVIGGEIASRLADRLELLEADPLRLEQVHERLAKLRRLIRRYGSVEAAIARREEVQQVIDDDDSMADRIAAIEADIVAAHSKFADAVGKLSSARAKGAAKLGRQITRSLAALGMERAELQADLTRTPAEKVDPVTADVVEIDGGVFEASAAGAESVEFLITPNLGEPLRPLVRIASGGEISRTMLAIKSVLAEHDPVDTMVFDEIDLGVSGRIAEAVGARMRELARHRQIIAITHLPQIAACAELHIAVEKREEEGRTMAVAGVLSPDERTRAVAELIGGAVVTQTALEHARSMLEASGAPEEAR